jgi:cytochrome oxidase Cu insertion factor (SCO1/SenC/PrrC family)
MVRDHGHDAAEAATLQARMPSLQSLTLVAGAPGSVLQSPSTKSYTLRRFMLKEGDKAPDFKSKDQNGDPVKLSDFKGKRVVLFFYPKDDTPG